jgi:hypothetical protein
MTKDEIVDLFGVIEARWPNSTFKGDPAIAMREFFHDLEPYPFDAVLAVYRSHQGHFPPSLNEVTEALRPDWSANPALRQTIAPTEREAMMDEYWEDVRRRKGDEYVAKLRSE